jgi:proteasome accessory factor A
MIDTAVVPKLCGADIELGNFTLGRVHLDDSMREASQMVLSEIAAISGVRASVADTEDENESPRDRGRTFLRTNGGCAYIDLDHLELCLPEVLSAYDHVACWHAMLRIARRALAAANSGRGPSREIQLLANNSDGHGHSYGSHLNVLVSRATWDNLVHRKPHVLAYLAAFQVSSLPLTGQGKVGSENAAPWVEYQLSQRADFFETVQGPQTTWRRPIVNTRDEPLCGRGDSESDELARLHVIFFDSTLCQVATLLRVGMIQIVAAMLEAGPVNSALALDDPLAAVIRWSHDPTLEATALLVSGERTTALQLQRRFLDEAKRFVDAGKSDGIVPRAAEIIALWEDTLSKLERREWDALVTRLDWVLKRELLRRTIERSPDLEWSSPEIKHLDLLYSSLDAMEGLYWNIADHGLLESVVSEDTIRRYTVEPPRDTRAWGRTMLLRHADRGVTDVDWDFVEVMTRDANGFARRLRAHFSDPLAATATSHPDGWWEKASLAEMLATLRVTLEERATTGCANGISRCGRQ